MRRRMVTLLFRTVRTTRNRNMKRFAGLLFSLCAVAVLAQAGTQNDLSAVAGPEAAPTFARYVPADKIPCQYDLPADASYGTVPYGFAAVDVILDENGTAKSIRISQTSGNADFDDLALHQSRLATCKPFPGLFGKNIPVETTFVFGAKSAQQLYPQKVRRLVRSHLIWHGSSVDLPTVILVNCAPDGKVLSATIVQSSGNVEWDAAALNAVQLSDPMPEDEKGKAPARFKITLYQQGMAPQSNANLH
ncbi:TonB family protein [Paraburkholderia fungorum]|nr:TonB family protein [Paraburkholderia fungorum]